MEYAELWSIRCQHESQLYDRSVFVTLTYSEDNLPWHRSLDVDHVQRFMKRLRKSYEGIDAVPEAAGSRPIRYFLGGEYGSETGRPHWHLLLFNWAPPEYDGRPRARELGSLSKLWPYGHHECDQFTAGRAAYVAGYATKKVRGRIAARRHYEVMHPETGEVYMRRPEFATQSRRPVGLGIWYFRRYRRDFERGYVSMPGGTRKRLPRLYQQYLSEDPEYAYAAEDRAEQYLLSDAARVDSTPQRLEQREAVHRARIGTYRKERGL